jgi:hypothetical protein
MGSIQIKKRQVFLMSSVAVVGALAATSVWAWQSPTKHKYLTKPLEICDQGTF